MGYLSNFMTMLRNPPTQVQLPAFVDGEVPTGIVDGVNKAFGLTNAPNPASSLVVWVNGIKAEPLVDYTLSGSTVTFVNPPAAGSSSGGLGPDVITVSYRH